MECPGDLKYTKEHEWVRVEGKTATVGITDFAQSELGEIVFVELPEIGQALEQGGALCVAESTKAASDVYAPIGGTVKEVNTALQAKPDLLNESPYDEGWIAVLEDAALEDLGNLMTHEEYQAYVEAQSSHG